MHTTEQAKGLWCPMARVVQIGAVETNAPYNRALAKVHVPVKIADTSSSHFELGEEPKVIEATMLKMTLMLSGAAMCAAGECAMWRWVDQHPAIKRIQAPAAETTVATPSIRIYKEQHWNYEHTETKPDGLRVDHLWMRDADAKVEHTGFCGLAGRPEVL